MISKILSGIAGRRYRGESRASRGTKGNKTRKQNSYEGSLLFMYNFPSGRIYFANVSRSWKLQEVVFGYGARFARGKEPSFSVVTQRAFSIETSFRVIGIQIFYPWHPGFFLLRDTRRVLPAEGGSKETIERAKRKGR